MLKNDICITVIGQAVLELFHFKVDIPRKSPRIRTSLTGKSIRMLCYFQDFQAESSPVLSEADVEEGLTWHVRVLYLLCDNVMYSISVA